MQSLRLSMLHCALCSAVAPLVFVSGGVSAAETVQQVEPVSSELFCDWLGKKPSQNKDAAATKPTQDDRTHPGRPSPHSH